LAWTGLEISSTFSKTRKERPEGTGVVLSVVRVLTTAFWTVFLALSCGPKSDRVLIAELMDRIGGWAEDREAERILGLLDEGYVDFEGRDKAAARVLLEDTLGLHRGIVIHVLATRIDEIKAGSASIRTDLAVSSGAAEFFRKLVRASADNYRFTIKLIKKGTDWKITAAEWEWISLDELFPESRSLLKKFLPLG